MFNILSVSTFVGISPTNFWNIENRGGCFQHCHVVWTYCPEARK